MSISPLACHYSQSLLFALCSPFHAEQTFLQIPSSPEIGAQQRGKAGPTLTATSHLHKLPCGRGSAPFPIKPALFMVSVHRYRVLLVQPNLGRPTKRSWLSPPEHAQLLCLYLPSDVCYPLTWARPQGHAQHLAQTRSWNQFRACVMNSEEMSGQIPINKENI